MPRMRENNYRHGAAIASRDPFEARVRFEVGRSAMFEFTASGGRAHPAERGKDHGIRPGGDVPWGPAGRRPAMVAVTPWCQRARTDDVAQAEAGRLASVYLAGQEPPDLALLDGIYDSGVAAHDCAVPDSIRGWRC